MIASDEDAERQQWAQFLEAVSKFIVAWVPLVEGQPILLPVASQLLFVRRYRVGRECEEVLEQAFDKLQAAAGQPKPPSGEQLKAQADMEGAKAEIEKAKIDAQAQMEGQGRRPAPPARLKHSTEQRWQPDVARRSIWRFPKLSGTTSSWRNRRLRPKTAFQRFPPVLWADLEGQQRVEGGPWTDVAHTSAA